MNDSWSEWLLNVRHAGDAGFRQAVQGQVRIVVDKVLDALELRDGTTLLDIGTGEGVVAFRAIERIGPSLSAILTDISAPLLQHAEQSAIALRVRDQCRFLLCGADELGALAAASIDAVTTRASLAYVANKPKALQEFHRVLKPGGRISLAEPILQDDAFEARALRELIERSANRESVAALALLQRCKSAQFPDTEQAIRDTPMTAYSERDLVRLAVSAGFTHIHMEFHIDMAPLIYPSWDAYLGSSPHPLAPPLATILAQRFSAAERAQFETLMRPRIEHAETLSTSRVAYLTARKPAK